MKSPLFLVLAICICITSVQSQILKGLGQKAKAKIEQRANNKVDKAMDKGLDKMDSIKIKKDADGSTKTKDADGTKTNTDGEPVTLKSYSKFDFVPGEKILYSEDFSQDVIGEFPTKWNTNGSGELMTIDGQPGKWLNLQVTTKYETPYTNTPPENYTIEFDVITDFKDNQGVPWIGVKLAEIIPSGNSYAGTFELSLNPANKGGDIPDAISFYSKDRGGNSFFNTKTQNHYAFTKANLANAPVHVAIWVQKQRVRVWLNEKKEFDIPRALAEGVQFKKFYFETTSGYGDFKYFISNIKVAAAVPDTRSRLLTEGKWSTTGILFDVASDRIKPSSYGVLKQIATTLQENEGVNIKVIGHTDSDGDNAKNLDLSKRRALAVKVALTKEFAIDSNRIETDGKGETEPADKNPAAEGKANNRRVEFVKS